MQKTAQHTKNKRVRQQSFGNASVEARMKRRCMAVTFAALIAAFCSLYERGLISWRATGSRSFDACPFCRNPWPSIV
jgi:hypothetical protein